MGEAQSGVRQAWRQLWLRRVDDPHLVEALLRHRAFRDRAPVENALSRYFFAPFEHQEVCQGDRFDRRAAWSRAALSGLDEQTVAAAASRHFTRWRTDLPRTSTSLLDEMRRLVLPLMCELAVGREHGAAVASVATYAVSNIDRCIKMMERANPTSRASLATALRPLTKRKAPHPAPSMLAAAQAAGVSLPPEELEHHLASVVLGTGTIQITDVLTHAVIAWAQHPLAVEAASTGGWLRETVRCYPVNASITRLAARAVDVEGHRYAAGEAITVYPGAVNRRGLERADDFRPARWDATASPGETPEGAFLFGWGPRACPAQRFSLQLLTGLLDEMRRHLRVRVPPGLRHRRSLALPTPVSLGRPGERLALPPRPQRLRPVARYTMNCATAYPKALWSSLPEVFRPPPAA